MNLRISILGCGWLGLALAIDLIDKGYLVHGSTTTNSNPDSYRDKILREQNIKPFYIDISQPNVEVLDFLVADVLIIAITSKSIQDFKNLIRNIEASRIEKVIFISSTSVYPNINSIVTEETETLNTPLAEIEKLFISNTSFKSTILRFGGLFGYDRKPGNFVNSNRPIENPEGYINFIHRDDCIAIIERVIAKNVWNEILNACSDEHPKRRDFYLKEIQKIGKSNLIFNENSSNEFKIVNSQKMKTLLNYEFRHSDFDNYK